MHVAAILPVDSAVLAVQLSLTSQQQQQQQEQSQQHNQSELAVSIAKDQQRCTQPTSSSGVTTSSETPTSTPATTPVPVPLTSHESAFIKQQPTADLPPITHNILSDAANLLQRPAAYAIPQTNDGMIMQSFLLEEVHRNNGENVSEAESTQQQQPSSDNIRFVPSIVFLPVKERISNKLVVSFTLTPA